jgi:hypothetical protein
MRKALAVQLPLALLVFLSGCATTTIKNSGTMGGIGSYEAEESGRHWTRPREISYEMGEKLEYSMKIDLSEGLVGEALVFGYPQPGQQANRYVSLAAAQAVAKAKVDGIYITNYTVDEDEAKGIVTVQLQGRSLVMRDLGLVDAERADRDRFTVVVEKDPVTGATKTYTLQVNHAIKSPVAAAPGKRVGLSKGAKVALDLAAFAATGVSGGIFLSQGILEAGIPFAVVSFGSLVKLVFDLIR